MSYSNVMATIAVFAALGTGGAYAANTIGADDVIDESLTGADVKDGTITGADVKWQSLGAGAIGWGAIGHPQLGGNAVWGGNVADGALTSDDVADDNLSGADVKDGSIGSADIAANTITGTQVNESTLGQVPSAKTADGAPVTGYHTVGKWIDFDAQGEAEGWVKCNQYEKVLGGSYFSTDIGGSGGFEPPMRGASEIATGPNAWDAGAYHVKARGEKTARLFIQATCVKVKL